jgi:hypothetical protein
MVEGAAAEYLDPACTFWTSLEHKPPSQKQVKSGLLDVPVMAGGKPIFMNYSRQSVGGSFAGVRPLRPVRDPNLPLCPVQTGASRRGIARSIAAERSGSGSSRLVLQGRSSQALLQQACRHQRSIL